MKQLQLVFILLLSGSTIVGQNIPYNTTPDWTSTPNGHIATGLGLADINGDGWKDLVAANGNDIQRQHLVVYYNQGDGTFPLSPDWSSEDIDYHGHLSCGDIDQDGDIDVAVSVYIGVSGFSSPGRVKVYYNEGNQLEASPSFISDPFYTFSCSLGDADGDGDLDLVTTGGEPYNSILDHGKIFINTNGTFQPGPEWESSIEMGSLDVEFGDIDRDGLMDVIFVCEDDDNYIYRGLPEGGISTVPVWQSAEALTYINSVDIGYRGSEECLVVMTENSQLGGQGKVRRYLFDGTLPASSTAGWYSNPFGYGSGIILADVDLDSELDLIYGGWWLPMNIALGEPGGFEITPSYTSQTNSVVEAIQMADLDRASVMEKTVEFVFDASTAEGHVLVLPDQLVENIIGIMRNGMILPSTDFCYTANKNWISFGGSFAEGDTLSVTYEYSPHPDIVITNWDSGKGNYIFYNTHPPVGLPDHSDWNISLEVFPNPATDLINLRVNGKNMGGEAVRITDLTGRDLVVFKISPEIRTRQLDISGLAAGVYIVNFMGQGVIFIKKG